MRLPLSACLAVLLASPCLAQVPAAKPTTRPLADAPVLQRALDANTVAFPATSVPTRLQLPAGVRTATLQVLRTDPDVARKLRHLAAWGLNVPASALRPSFWLAPQVPYLADGDASFQVAARQRYIVGYTASERFPRGWVEAYGRNEADLRFVLSNVPASPRRWLLLECPAEGSRTYTVTYWAANAPGAQPRRVAIARTGLTQTMADPRVRTLIEPSASAAIDVQVHGMDSPEGEWRFGGCEITPFEP